MSQLLATLSPTTVAASAAALLLGGLGAAILARLKYLRAIQDIPGPPFSFWLGATETLRGSPCFITQRHLALRQLHARYGPTVKIVFPFSRGALIVYAQAGDIEPAFKNNVKAFPARPNRTSILPNGLLALPTAHKWRAHRSALLPALSTKAMRGYFPAIVKHAELMCDFLAHESKLEPDVDVHKPLTAATLCVISQIGFGVPMGPMREVISSPLMEYGSALLEGQVKMLATPGPVVRLVRSLPSALMPRSQRRMFKALAIYTKQARDVYDRTAHDESGSLLEALASAQLPFEEARDEIITLLVAGHETTANSLSWALYLLSQHPQAQAKARAEVEAVIARRTAHAPEDSSSAPSDNKLSFDDLPHLAYARSVFLEALRLYPTVPMVARICAQDAQVGGYVLPKGSTLGYSIACASRDPAKFDNPNAFEPERFGDAPDGSLWHPFGPEGPRKCMGFRLADAEALVFLATILSRFEIEPASERAEPPREYTDATLGPKESGLRLRFRPLAPREPAQQAHLSSAA